MAVRKTKTKKVAAVNVLLKDVKLNMLSGENDNFLLFQENENLYVFHWCGENEKSEWFRKTKDWDETTPICELCNKGVPERLSSIVKLHESGL